MKRRLSTLIEVTRIINLNQSVLLRVQSYSADEKCCPVKGATGCKNTLKASRPKALLCRSLRGFTWPVSDGYCEKYKSVFSAMSCHYHNRERYLEWFSGG